MKLVVVMPEMLSTLPVGAEVRFMKTMYEAAPSTACHVMVGLAAAVVPATGEVIVGCPPIFRSRSSAPPLRMLPACAELTASTHHL